MNLSVFATYWNQYWTFLLILLTGLHLSAQVTQIIAISITVMLALIALRIVGAILNIFSFQPQSRYRRYGRYNDYYRGW